jgi:hypothetical protein
MKRWMAWILSVVLLISLAACADSGEETVATEPETTGPAYPQIAERLCYFYFLIVLRIFRVRLLHQVQEC